MIDILEFLLLNQQQKFNIGLNGLDSFPSKRCVEVLTPRTSECNIIWKVGSLQI